MKISLVFSVIKAVEEAKQVAGETGDPRVDPDVAEVFDADKEDVRRKKEKKAKKNINNNTINLV